MPKPKITETLAFVRGLLSAADGVSWTISEGFEPRRVLARKHSEIANLEHGKIEELGKYQGRVVLVALAAELALKFAWEAENQRPADNEHDLRKLFDRLPDHVKQQARDAYRRRVPTPYEPDWETADQVFEICRNAFVSWRYIVEENSYPNYIMRATYLKDATLCVIDAIES